MKKVLKLLNKQKAKAKGEVKIRIEWLKESMNSLNEIEEAIGNLNNRRRY